MARYYFLSCYFPVITIGRDPDISFFDLKDMFKINLSDEDKKMAGIIFQFIDLKNLYAYILHQPIDNRGTLNEQKLSEAVEGKIFFPDYVFSFLEQYTTKGERANNFSSIFVEFFERHTVGNSFISKYFSFQRDCKLIVTALRAKREDRDIVEEIKFEDPKDYLIAYILAQKDMDTFEPPLKFRPLKELYENNVDNPLKLYKAFLKYQFSNISEMVDLSFFTIDQVLSYMVCLMLVEDWASLDREKEKKIVEKTLL